MGTTIDKSILYMSLYKQRLEESISDGLEEDIEAYDLAITSMRKYQKIVEIADEWKHDHDNLNYADDSYYWNKVREVLEDGNDD